MSFGPDSNAFVDITNVQFPDNHFDAVICHHVLEHVIPDEQGMRECFRVLKPDGMALFSVPMDITRRETLERPAQMSAADFEKIVGWDHKRRYGLDFEDKLAAASFRDVRTIDFTPEEADRFRLASKGMDRVFVCTK